jgi:hypothetical protein|tara:strand:- start:42 stop:521 length:480 start_codon:yes stop_codon:yes gene_type:complete
MNNIIGNIKKFIVNTIKYTIFYPFMIIMAYSIIVGIWDAVTSDNEATVDVEVVTLEIETKEQADKKVADKLAADKLAAEVKIINDNQDKARQLLAETAKHTSCRLELHSENPYGGTYNGLSNLVWDTSAFGTFDDGEVWVGYNRKVGNKVYKNMVKICN